MPKGPKFDALVTVYGFKMWSKTEGRYRVSKFKAPREVIEKYEVVPMAASAEAVPRSDLDGRGRYLPPEYDLPDSWRSSSFDLQSGLDLTEDPPGVLPT